MNDGENMVQRPALTASGSKNKLLDQDWKHTGLESLVAKYYSFGYIIVRELYIKLGKENHQF